MAVAKALDMAGLVAVVTVGMTSMCNVCKFHRVDGNPTMICTYVLPECGQAAMAS